MIALIPRLCWACRKKWCETLVAAERDDPCPFCGKRAVKRA